MNPVYNILSTKQITVIKGDNLICENLDISIKSGERWGVLGQNGRGKTTLLHALAGLHPLEKGNIYLNKQNIKHLPFKTLAQKIGLLFQDTHHIFPQTVWEYCLSSRYAHLNYFKKETEEDKQIILQALKQMELEELIKRKITELSGGEKRRLAIACLIAQAPCFYLLDEPTNHLDIRYQLSILNYFRHLAYNKLATFILSLHDMNLAQQFCSHVLLLLPDGEIVQGPLQNIFTSENLSRLYQQPIISLSSGNRVWWTYHFG